MSRGYGQVEHEGEKAKRRLGDLGNVVPDGSFSEMHAPAMGYGGLGVGYNSFENDKFSAKDAKSKRRFGDLDQMQTDGSCQEMHVVAMGYGGRGVGCASLENATFNTEGVKRKQRSEDLSKAQNDGRHQETHVPAMGYGGGGVNSASIDNYKPVMHEHRETFVNQDVRSSTGVQYFGMEVECFKAGSPEMGGRPLPTGEVLPEIEELLKIPEVKEIIMTTYFVPNKEHRSSDDEGE